MDATSVLKALWLFLPAYVANMSPVFTAKLLPKWSHPIDGGRMADDGERLLGDGKTWRGLVGGGFAGGWTAVFMALAAPYFPGGLVAGWDFGKAGHCVGQAIGSACPPTDGVGSMSFQMESVGWIAIFLFGFIVGFFALAGDAIESYVKRRTGRKRGAPWFPFDQLDFVVFGLIGMVLASFLLPAGWVTAALLHDWIILTTILVLTPGLHLLINRIGYWLKLKEVPW